MKPTLLACFSAAALLLAGCSTVESRISSNRADYDAWPAQVQQLVSAGKIGIGFTPQQVQVALGKPDYQYVRTDATGQHEVWSYRDRRPRFGFGVGMGSFHGRSAYSTGIGLSTGDAYPDERLRVIFDQTGRVSLAEEVRHSR